ncbi:DUF1735 domain-containing protein [Pedobacter sp. L105]|uniref:DUF1735 domain-containing protein n=1 Tax=Pedobacter sp. L105 TaxID=1641871 RepID=UPI00131C6245|nr:DUF1735 domain-containing protein [Pedobacter sp. L105]
MKYKNHIKTVALCLLTMTVFSSCLKDKTYVDFKDAGATIDFPAVAYHGEFNDISLAASPTLTAYPVLVNVSVPKALSTAVHIVLKVDPAALTAYNTAQAAAGLPVYTLMSTNNYTIPDLTATVPANQTSGSVTVNFNTSAILTTDVLPLTIISTDAGVINQYNTILYHVTVK